MSKAARRLAFALKAAQPFGVTAHFRRQDFDRNPVTEQNVTRAIDCAHAALPQQRFDLVLTVEGFAHERAGIFFQHLAVFRAETYAVVEFFVTE
jgi:formyltetrahydrofolate hydrolase